jgi:ribosome modulation factor
MNGRKEEARRRRKRQEGQVRFGTKAGMSGKTKEMSVYDRSIKVLQHPGQTRWRPCGKLGSKV